MTMRVVSIPTAGGYDRLRVVERELPVVGEEQVRVRTGFVGVNYADCIVRMGLYESARKLVGWPITPGFEFAGTVDACGARVERVRVGDVVFGVSRFGAYATHVVVPEHQVFSLPNALSLEEGAAFPAANITAWFALVELCRMRPGMRVLVHSAAGGVGTALVQIARRFGCHVVGVVGTSAKVSAAQRAGAHVVIDKSREDLWAAASREAPAGYDVVLDANGVSTLAQSFEHTRSPGRLVVYGFHSMLPRSGGRPSLPKLAFDWLRTPRFDPLKLTSTNRSVLAFNLSYLFEQREILDEAMRDLLDWLAGGTVRAPSVRVMAFRDVARAHAELESGSTTGKLVLDTRDA